MATISFVFAVLLIRKQVGDANAQSGQEFLDLKRFTLTDNVMSLELR